MTGTGSVNDAVVRIDEFASHNGHDVRLTIRSVSIGVKAGPIYLTRDEVLALAIAAHEYLSGLNAEAEEPGAA